MAQHAERALCFGAGQRLLGLLNHRPDDGPVACLMLNVGVTVRSGPRRLNVKMARALAAISVTSMRFDLSGIGDSAPADANDAYQAQAVADLRAAMDAVQAATGAHRFVLLGICSGAVHAYRAAAADQRVAGLMMFDGYAFPNWASRLLHDWRRLCTTPPSALAGKAANRMRRFIGMPVKEAPVSIFYASRDASSPDRKAFAAAMDALAARGASMLVVYSGSLLALHNHRGQFRRVFRGHPFLARTQDHYLPHIDHIPTTQAAQAEFLALVTAWVKQTAVTCIR